MRRTATRSTGTNDKMTVNINTLADMLDCGIDTARKVGTSAGARVQIGTRVLYRTDKVNEYLERMTAQETA